MVPPTSLLDPGVVIVADASTVINLCASGRARDMLQALESRVVILDAVSAELQQGTAKGRKDGERLQELVREGLIEVVSLGGPGMTEFEGLVIGAASDTLDDGEAATIAYALETGAFPLIDEHKANQLCARRFPALKLGCTVDVFAHPAVGRRMGADGLADAVLSALQGARMHVPSSRHEWIVNLIGPVQARTCNSLPLSVRNRLAADLKAG